MTVSVTPAARAAIRPQAAAQAQVAQVAMPYISENRTILDIRQVQAELAFCAKSRDRPSITAVAVAAAAVWLVQIAHPLTQAFPHSVDLAAAETEHLE